jgi:hypothetical protein
LARLPLFEIVCNRCDRRDRLRTACLVAVHGAAVPMPDLLRVLSADCPRRQAMERSFIADVCSIHCPELDSDRLTMAPLLVSHTNGPRH